MAVELSPKNRSELKRKIAELKRFRTDLKLKITSMRAQPGSFTGEELTETKATLARVERELRDLVQCYEGHTSPLDSRD